MADDHAIWGGGQLLCFSGIDGPTDFDHGLTLRTSFAPCAIDVKLPTEGRIHLDDAPPQSCRVGSGYFDLRTSRGPVKGAVIDAYHLLIEGPCETSIPGASLIVRRRGSRTLIGSRYGFDAACIDADLDSAIAVEHRWVESRPVPASAPPLTRKSLRRAYAQMRGMVYSAQGQLRRRFTTPDRWPHRGMWLWDSAFHAIGLRHADPGLAAEILEAVFDAQREDGFVSIRSDPDVSRQEFTQPPTLAMSAELVARKLGDRAWMARIYPKLCGYVRWDLANRDRDGAGLPEWEIQRSPECRSGESGMDNSPRFDSAARLDATDFSAFLANECEALSRIAGQLGLEDDAQRWRAEHQRLCRLINQRLWSDEHGFYVDYDVDRGAPSDVLASAGFLPLLCGAPSARQAEALARALGDPRLFATALPVASIAVKDEAHYAKDMWRGPVWVNINWCIARGFARYGMHEQAGLIRSRTLAEIERAYARHGTFFEFYDDRGEVEPPRLCRKGRCAPEVSPFHQVFYDYGWTAALYVDWLLDDDRSAPSLPRGEGERYTARQARRGTDKLAAPRV